MQCPRLALHGVNTVELLLGLALQSVKATAVEYVVIPRLLQHFLGYARTVATAAVDHNILIGGDLALLQGGDDLWVGDIDCPGQMTAGEFSGGAYINQQSTLGDSVEGLCFALACASAAKGKQAG